MKKTQGNLAKTQLSANSELVRNAEFCPKKAWILSSIVVSLVVVFKNFLMSLTNWFALSSPITRNSCEPE